MVASAIALLPSHEYSTTCYPPSPIRQDGSFGYRLATIPLIFLVSGHLPKFFQLYEDHQSIHFLQLIL